MNWIKNKCIFYPDKKLTWIPSQKYQDVFLESKFENDRTIHGWYIYSSVVKNAQVILLFHGNAGNISYRHRLINFLHSLGFHIFIIDYAGYGWSSGTPNEERCFHDAWTAWDYLRRERKFEKKNIIIYGESLGVFR